MLLFKVQISDYRFRMALIESLVNYFLSTPPLAQHQVHFLRHQMPPQVRLRLIIAFEVFFFSLRVRGHLTNEL